MRRLLARAHLVGVAAVLATGAAVAALGQQPANVVTAVPDKPRAVDGSNPLARLPGPSECAPGRDRSIRRNYFPLSQLKQHRVEDPFVRRAPYSVALDLVNRKRQRFLIYLSAGSAAPVKRLIASSSACLERFALSRPMPAAVVPVRLDALLVAAAVRATNLSQAKLSVIRDELAAAEKTASLAAVLTNRRVDPDAVIKDAARDADAQLRAKVAAGELSAAEVAAVNTRRLMQRLAHQPRAPFLYPPQELSRDPAELGRRLREDPRRSVALSMKPVGALDSKRTVVWFVVDPNVNKDVVHAYRSQCRRSAWTRIKAWAGSAMVRLWRAPPPDNVGSATATAPNLSSQIVRTSETLKTYDVNVKGLQNGSTYTIEGGWVMGSGGGC